jgi:outer membrane protein assembly factor BamB
MFFQTAVPVAAAAKTLSTLAQSPDKREGIFTKIKDSEKVYAFDVVCLDRMTGKAMWTTTVCKKQPHEGFHQDHGYASYSPVTDGKHVWVSFGSRGVYCLDMTGKIRWRQKDVPQMKTRASFGEGSSPAIVGDKLIVLADQEGDSAILAFDKNTGKRIWRQARDEGTSWTTPVIVDVGGRQQIIVSGAKASRCYDPANGKVIWTCSGQTQNVIPTPPVAFGMVYCMSGFRGNCLQAITLGKTGDLTGTDAVAWQIDKYTSYVPSAVLSDGKLFFCTANTGKLSCVDAKTGKVHYANQALDGVKFVYASLVGVGDRIYIAGRKGNVAVVKNSTSFKQLAANTLDDGFDASPVIIGTTLYLKGRKSLYAIAE